MMSMRSPRGTVVKTVDDNIGLKGTNTVNYFPQDLFFVPNVERFLGVFGIPKVDC